MGGQAVNLTIERQAAEVFLAAIGLDHAERDRFISASCAGDSMLCAHVDRLIRADARSHEDGDPLRPSARGEGYGRFAAGTVIGHYTIVRLLGSGGMASVYEAVQDSPRRAVALKFMSHGIGSADALRRFRRESQILGHLRHPGVAHVHEAGLHDDGHGGVPYFAMEYVPDARTITEWADHAHLNLSQRVDLFLQACESVAHGHRLGVIHRDIKPSNVLVDASGIVKVIDFGIARAVDVNEPIPPERTETGNLLGTLQYMSPEQVGRAPDRLDARTDVYSLGIVLYELAVGDPPYEVGSTGVLDAATIIRERMPPRPSSLNRAVSGDLETIILKALDKDPGQRYSSAAEFADDLSRLRENRPIAARPHSLGYRVRTLVRRNKAMVGGVAAAFAVLVVALAVVSTMAIRLRREASRREEVIGFLDSLLIAADAYPFGPSRRQAPALGADARWVDAIDHAVSTLDESPLDDRLAEASIRHRIGMIDFWMCRFDRAQANLRWAYDVRRAAVGDLDETTIDTRIGIVLCGVFLGDNIVAEESARRVVDDCRRALGPANRRTLDALHAWYITLLYLDYNDPLDDIAHEMRDIASRRPELGYPQSVYEAFLGHAVMLDGRFDESESMLRQAITHSEVDSPGSLTHAWAWVMLGWLQQARGDHALAEDYMRRGRDMWLARSGPNMAEFEIIVDIAMIRQPHKRAEGLERLRRSVESVRAQVGDDHPFFSAIAFRASEGYMVAEEWAAAAELLRAGMKYWQSPRHVWLQRDAMAMARLAEVLRQDGRLDEAEASMRQAVEIADKFTREQWGRHYLGDAGYFRTRLAALLDERALSK